MNKIARPLVTFLVATAVFLAVLFGCGILSAENAQECVRIWSDAFSVPGILFFLSGAFVWIARQGTFSGMGFACRQIWVSLHSKQYREEHRESYSEYRERRLAGKKVPFIYLILTGVCFLIPAILLSIVFFFI